MALQHGSVGEFDHAAEDWETYVECVDLYLTANGITTAGQKIAVLLSVCAHIDLAAPTKPAELRYDYIVKLVQTHYDPKRGVAVHRFRFNSRSRQQGEKVSEYVAARRHLAIHETRLTICCSTGLHAASTTSPFSAGYSQSLILTSRKC